MAQPVAPAITLSIRLTGHFVDRRPLASPRLATIRPGPSRARSGVEVIPQPGAASFPFAVAGCARGRRQRATAPLERRLLALPPPLDRNDDLPRRSQRPSTLQSAFGLGNEVRRAPHRLIRADGDDGARPEVGWVPLGWTSAQSLGRATEPFTSTSLRKLAYHPVTPARAESRAAS
jgi:hypothetical protein